jgi:hypothetical protein
MDGSASPLPPFQTKRGVGRSRLVRAVPRCKDVDNIAGHKTRGREQHVPDHIGMVASTFFGQHFMNNS